MDIIDFVGVESRGFVPLWESINQCFSLSYQIYLIDEMCMVR